MPLTIAPLSPRLNGRQKRALETLAKRRPPRRARSGGNTELKAEEGGCGIWLKWRDIESRAVALRNKSIPTSKLEDACDVTPTATRVMAHHPSATCACCPAVLFMTVCWLASVTDSWERNRFPRSPLWGSQYRLFRALLQGYGHSWELLEKWDRFIGPSWPFKGWYGTSTRLRLNVIFGENECKL